MNQVRKVFSDSAFTAIRSVITIGRGVVVIPLIVNLLGAGSYGVWVTVLAIIGLLDGTGGLHLHGALIRYNSKGKENNQAYSDIMFLILIISTTISIAILIIGLNTNLSFIFSNEISNGDGLVIVGAILLFSSLIFRINVNFPRSKGSVKLYDSIKIVKLFVEILVLFCLFILGGGIIAGLFALSIISIVSNILMFSAIMFRYNIPLPNKNNFDKYIKYGFPMMPATISSSVLQHIDKYLLIYFLGPTTVGIYAVAQAICKPIVNLTDVFNPTLYPTISKSWDENRMEDIKEIYYLIFRYYSIIGFPTVIGVVIISEPLLLIISTPNITDKGLFLVPIFIIGYFLRGYDSTIRYVLTSAERTNRIGFSVFLSMAVNLIVNLLLIPRIGMMGAAIATLIAHTLMFILILYYAISEITIAIPWRTIGRSLIASLVMGGSLTILDLELSKYMSIVINPLLGILIYFLVLFLMGEISWKDLSKSNRRN